MRYAQMRKMDISNGEGIGVALFVQGCKFHCPGCFNAETWDFGGGKEWTAKTQKTFLKLASNLHVSRITIIGGEPLADENVQDVQKLLYEIRVSLNGKKVWLYTGFLWEDIFHGDSVYFGTKSIKKIRQEVVTMCDVVVDGRYIEELRDLNLRWRGSSNQRVIDVKKSLRENKVVLYCN